LWFIFLIAPAFISALYRREVVYIRQQLFARMMSMSRGEMDEEIELRTNQEESLNHPSTSSGQAESTEITEESRQYKKYENVYKF
jgi:hypothetical protein